jgi:hypothetical protein
MGSDRESAQGDEQRDLIFWSSHWLRHTSVRLERGMQQQQHIKASLALACMDGASDAWSDKYHKLGDLWGWMGEVQIGEEGVYPCAWVPQREGRMQTYGKVPGPYQARVSPNHMMHAWSHGGHRSEAWWVRSRIRWSTDGIAHSDGGKLNKYSK